MDDKEFPYGKCKRCYKAKEWERRNKAFCIPCQDHQTRYNRIAIGATQRKQWKYKGLTYPSLLSICKERGVNYKKVYYRIRNGWELEAAIDTPMMFKNRNRKKPNEMDSFDPVI